MTAAGENFYKYLTGLDPELVLPKGVSVINPYPQAEVKVVLKKFCDVFYRENNTRVLILGINPGRFGAGSTGIPFTDPVALEQNCGITNSFKKQQELSSKFIYEMIEAFGGVKKFYSRFLLSAVCPLGFLQGKTNHNYYDSSELMKATTGLIRRSLTEHASWNSVPCTVISLGKKNASCLKSFNSDFKLFDKIIALEHPRYIMQYKLQSKSDCIEQYCEVLSGL